MSIEEFRNLVTDFAEYGYRFTDTEYGFCKIPKESIVEQSPGIAVSRFRLDVADEYSIQHFVNAVCKKINDTPRLMVDKRKLYGLPYLECAWISVINNDLKGKDDDISNTIENRIADRFDQDFDSSKYTGDMFA